MTTNPTPADLIAQAEAVMDDVSAGSWKVVKNRDGSMNVISGPDEDGDTHKVCLVNGADASNARFIAHARQAVPALIAALRAMQAERDAARKIADHDKALWLSAEAKLAEVEKERDELAAADRIHSSANAGMKHRLETALAAAEATVATLTAQVEAMRRALIAEREEVLWFAYNTGIERDGRWSDACMSDAEWLVRECGLDPEAKDHPADAVKAAIPEAAKRAALTTEKTNG